VRGALGESAEAVGAGDRGGDRRPVTRGRFHGRGVQSQAITACGRDEHQGECASGSPHGPHALRNEATRTRRPVCAKPCDQTLRPVLSHTRSFDQNEKDRTRNQQHWHHQSHLHEQVCDETLMDCNGSRAPAKGRNQRVVKQVYGVAHPADRRDPRIAKDGAGNATAKSRAEHHESQDEKQDARRRNVHPHRDQSDPAHDPKSIPLRLAPRRNLPRHEIQISDQEAQQKELEIVRQ